MKTIKATKLDAKNLPASSGVYLFRDEKKVIYIGKAINLKNRVGSYFAQRLELKTAKMVASAQGISYIPVDSEFEALLLEARLVKKYKPKFNIELRDDKSPLYIGITGEEFPKVITLRQTQIDKFKLSSLYGPFIDTGAVRRVLKFTRRIFTFSTHSPGKRPCVYSQIGLCKPCPSEIIGYKDIDMQKYYELKKEYLTNIRRFRAVLSGNSKKILAQLKQEMNEDSKHENFEDAREVEKKINSLKYIIERPVPENSYIENPNLLEDIRLKELISLKKYILKYYEIGNLDRIECFDIAHLAGSFPTASMVTFINGEPDKALYRHYKISDKKAQSDTDSMKLVLTKRKFRFKTWGTPDLIIVDGGKGQLSVALAVIDEVPVVGLAKREETLVFYKEGKFHELKLPESPAKKLVQRIRDEAHRFARSYHHKLVSRAIRGA